MGMDEKVFETLMEMKGQLGGIDEKLDDLKSRRLDHETRIVLLETFIGKVKGVIAIGGALMLAMGAAIGEFAKGILHKLGWS